MIAWLRAGIAVIAFAVMTIVLLPVQELAVLFGWSVQRRIATFYHRAVLRILGIRVHAHAAMAGARPLLIVANHVSWKDIPVLASIGYVSFIAKSDMRGWPLFGALARLQHTVFVEREAKGKAGKQADEIAGRIADGDAMVLFPEGTTAGGNRILRFKSSLFGAAQMVAHEAHGETVWVQPLSIAYTRMHGLPMGRVHRRVISYTGDEGMAPSLLACLKGAAIDAEVRFGEPVAFAPGTDRKQFARMMEAAVGALMAESLHPRAPR